MKKKTKEPKKSKETQDSELSSEEAKVKGVGLFEHVKHIREVQDPDYYKNLSELDKKTFSHFMILRAISMNPAFVEDSSWLFRYFDLIPSEQFYRLLITVFPAERKFYPWVKSKKDKLNKELVELVAKRFEISTDRANEYISMMINMDGGMEELVKICQGYGLNDKDIERVLTNE